MSETQNTTQSPTPPANAGDEIEDEGVPIESVTDRWWWVKLTPDDKRRPIEVIDQSIKLAFSYPLARVRKTFPTIQFIAPIPTASESAARDAEVSKFINLIKGVAFTLPPSSAEKITTLCEAALLLLSNPKAEATHEN